MKKRQDLCKGAAPRAWRGLPPRFNFQNGISFHLFTLSVNPIKIMQKPIQPKEALK